MEAVVTNNYGGRAGIRWWLIDAGSDISHERVITQIIKLTLDPVLMHESQNTHQVEIRDVLISDAEIKNSPPKSLKPITRPEESE